jgi:tRNA pseudouridine synthase 9
MALIEVPQPQTTSYPPLEEKQPFKPPPPVLITPCDPWPHPYFLENGLRRVAPYHFTYNTYCKERWRGRELLDIFSSEFRDRPLAYYVSSPAEN